MYEQSVASLLHEPPLLGFSDLGDAGWLRDKCEELRYQPKILVEKSGLEGPGTSFQLIDLGIGSKRLYMVKKCC